MPLPSAVQPSSAESTVLAFDTVNQKPNCALYHEGQMISRLWDNNRSQTLSTDLVPTLQSLLAQASIDFADISVMAALVGPGSFTGIRLGLATALGFSLTLPQCEIFTPTVLDLWSYAGWIATKRPVIAAIDTNRDDYYTQIINADFGLHAEPGFMTAMDIVQMAGENPHFSIVTDSQSLCAQLPPSQLIPLPEATAVTLIDFYGFSQTFQGRIIGHAAQPFYLRNPIFLKQKLYRDIP